MSLSIYLSIFLGLDDLINDLVDHSEFIKRSVNEHESSRRSNVIQASDSYQDTERIQESISNEAIITNEGLVKNQELVKNLFKAQNSGSSDKKKQVILFFHRHFMQFCSCI